MALLGGIMDEQIIEAIKSIATEGADLSAVETALTGYVKDPLSEITDKDKATEFIKSNPLFNSALDSNISKAVEVNRQKLLSEDFPQRLAEERQKLLKELNKEPSESEKLQAQIDEMKREQKDKEKTAFIEKELMKTFDSSNAAALGFTAEDLTSFTPLGDDAVPTFAKIYGRFAEVLKSSNEAVLKDKYKGEAPKTGDKPQERDHWAGINTSWLDK